MQVSLDGTRAFITAGGAGMGRATALAMLDAGAEVFTCDIDEAALETGTAMMAWLAATGSVG